MTRPPPLHVVETRPDDRAIDPQRVALALVFVAGGPAVDVRRDGEPVLTLALPHAAELVRTIAATLRAIAWRRDHYRQRDATPACGWCHAPRGDDGLLYHFETCRTVRRAD
jgi:hypothetical protein